MSRPKKRDQDALFDRDLADVPGGARWREWMGRVEAAIFASREPVARDALADFDEWTNRMTQPLETSSPDVRFADRLVRDFATKLAAPDALHLAIALKHGLQLVTFDERLGGGAEVWSGGGCAGLKSPSAKCKS